MKLKSLTDQNILHWLSWYNTVLQIFVISYLLLSSDQICASAHINQLSHYQHKFDPKHL